MSTGSDARPAEARSLEPVHVRPEGGRRPLVAILGNPNAGKSTLFNRLTGLRQKVGNYPGVTVEKKMGTCFLPSGRKVTRTIVAFNDEWRDTEVTIDWDVTADGEKVAGGKVKKDIPPGAGEEFEITFITPRVSRQSEIVLHLRSHKAGRETFREANCFCVRP